MIRLQGRALEISELYFASRILDIGEATFMRRGIDYRARYGDILKMSVRAVQKHRDTYTLPKAMSCSGRDGRIRFIHTHKFLGLSANV